MSKQISLEEIENGRRRESEMQKHFEFVETRTQVTPLDFSLALKVGETDFLMKKIKRVKNWPIADSIVLATPRAHSAYVVSGDPHFNNAEDAIFIGDKTRV